jgi:hypothetical protein
MGRRYEVDVMTSNFLQPKHDDGEFFWFYLFPSRPLTDVIVLTILATQIAPREEDRA